MAGIHATTDISRALLGPQPSLRDMLDRARHELLDMFATPAGSGLALARKHAQMMDDVLIRVHDTELARTRRWRRAPVFALAAVGCYGRQLLGWKSDIELRFITSGPVDKIQPVVDAMTNSLRDVGVGIKAQVLTVSDALTTAVHDWASACTLLDLRVLAGDATLIAALHERAYASVFSEAQLPRFLTLVHRETEQRHKRFGDCVYLLEPDIESVPGGMRDLDSAIAMATACWRTSDPNELERRGILSARDAHNMQLASEFLWTLRNHIHLRMGCRCDQLTFAAQPIIARALEYPSRAAKSADVASESMPGASIEMLMLDYYGHARTVMRVCEQIREQAAQLGRTTASVEQDLGGGLCERDARIGPTQLSALAAEPVLALRLYVAAIERNTPLTGQSRDVIAELASNGDWVARLRASGEANVLFVQLVCDSRRAPFRGASIMRELHDVGLLVAMVPEFAPLMGRAHRDLQYAYTVDAHSVAAVDRLRAILRGELTQQHPLASQVAARLAQPHVLCMATLLHDIGKASGRGGYVQRGADMAGVILERLGLSAEDNAAACKLIRNQHTLYLAALRRDLEDPATLAEFAREGQSPEGLRALYLLTVVNVSTISANSMTKWKSAMLDALFHACDMQLMAASTAQLDRLSQLRADFKQQWAGHDEATLLDEFLDSMPERYLLTNSAKEIIAHAQVAGRLADHPVSAGFVPSRHAEVAELCVVTETSPDAGVCVVTDDQPGVLASITAAIAANRLEIHSAQIHSRFLPNGSVQAVDLFWVRSPDGPAAVAAALPNLERDFERVITGRVSARELLTQAALESGASGRSERVRTEVVFNHHASAKHTIIQVLTRDRPGLLFTVAQVLHELGINISVAKISTEGHRASDVFYVTEFDGTKLDSETRSRAVRERLVEVLTQPRAL